MAKFVRANSAGQRNNTTGAWRLVCEDLDLDASSETYEQTDEVWSSLCTVHKDDPCLFSKPPLKIANPSNSLTYIICSTPSSADEAQIRLAAEYIRSRVLFPFPIHYMECKADNPKDRTILFQHTPEAELYKHSSDGIHIVTLKSDARPLGPFPTPALGVGDNGSLLPSEVFDERYLYMPSTEEAISNMKSPKGGKWMVFSLSMDSHDAAWRALLSVYQMGFLVGLKAATNVLNPVNSRRPTSGFKHGGFKRTDPVILCYTEDSEDRNDVLRAVVAIRKAVDSDCILFYKTNYASIHGQYYHEGNRSVVTKYQHTVEGGLYERDHVQRYKLIVPGNVNGCEM